MWNEAMFNLHPETFMVREFGKEMKHLG
jgi:hypothetical protein